MAEDGNAFQGLTKDSLVALAVEQNARLKDLLGHSKQLQEDNDMLRQNGAHSNSEKPHHDDDKRLVESLRGQLSAKDCQVKEMEAKIQELVAKTKELLDDYCRLQKQQEGIASPSPPQRQDTSTRERGVALAPTQSETAALRVENEKLQTQLTIGASHAAADTAEVAMLKERQEALEKTVRNLRGKLVEAEARARNAEAKLAGLSQGQDTPSLTATSSSKSLTSLASKSIEADKAAANSSSTELGVTQSTQNVHAQGQPRPSDPLKLSSKQVAGLAATIVGGGKSSSSKRSLNLEGTLQKQGGGWGPFKAHFKERYFELRGAQGTLYYSAKKGGVPLGEIDLEQTTVAEAAIRPFSFCLLGPKLQRTYVLAAANPQEREKWMDAIKHASEHYTRFVDGNSDKKADQTNGNGSYIASMVDGVGDASCVYNSAVVDGSPNQPAHVPTLPDFELLVVVGVGSFGKVLKVRHRQDGKIYAMKVLQKETIVKHHMVPHTRAEKEILEASNHPFVVKMYYAFQTRRQLVFILDFLTGGELFYHLANEQRFSEDRARFYAAEIALALEHLHKQNIIYRDLKPENLVLDKDGHVCLTDFGLAKTEVTELTHTFCGTPQYMAPELILKQGHGRAADWWSLGVFLFEMIAGVAPFPNNGNVRELYEAIVTKVPPFPPWMSYEARSCLNRMLAKEPQKRTQSVDTLFASSFFKCLDPKKVESKEIPVPFKPQHRGDDTRYIDAGFKREQVDVGPNPTDPKEGATIVFDNFTFVRGGR
ncbi:RAC family serine/threonine-protein kinase-like protein [Diplonema papillatum]|nr:RAC family serine/threonine-protein kinase-like protein [Diplonema papillatum]KAJ9456425.1 RAC family serine/threonine-protein kinase-like protein [Diplonema papillatum]